MFRYFLYLCMLLAGVFTPASAFSARQPPFLTGACGNLSVEISVSGDSLQKNQDIQPNADAVLVAENRRALAIILNVTLGMLGVHRLYLGTKPWVPAVYLFTFGGGFFVLPLVDLVFLIANRDISRFENNPRVLMWLPEKSFNQEGN